MDRKELFEALDFVIRCRRRKINVEKFLHDWSYFPLEQIAEKFSKLLRYSFSYSTIYRAYIYSGIERKRLKGGTSSFAFQVANDLGFPNMTELVRFYKAKGWNYADIAKEVSEKNKWKIRFTRQAMAYYRIPDNCMIVKRFFHNLLNE